MLSLVYALLFISLYVLSLSGGRSGRIFFHTGMLLHAGYIAYRAVFLGRLPVTERHDILMSIAFGAALGRFIFGRSGAGRRHQYVVSGFVLLYCFLAVFQERMDTIEPIMNTRWFYLHIALFIVGFVLFTYSAVSGVLYLLVDGAHHEKDQYRFALFGWIFFSFSLIAGGIWFFRAYGVYWLWTSKELWTTIAWFYYGFYLHSRMVMQLRGWTASIIGETGLAVMLFAYLGVGPLLGSPWTQF